MRRKGIYAAALVLMLALGGCGQKQAEKDTKAETTEAEEDSTQNVVSDGEANFRGQRNGNGICTEGAAAGGF